MLGPLAAMACASGPASSPPPPTAARRAILVSFDAMNEQRARTTVAPRSIPTLLRFFDQASCADGARPMFPSYTAASHAALWTGAYGNVNGIAGNELAPLPWSEFSIADARSGYDSRQLTAQPIWISAVLSGLRVAAHHVTQAPGSPGYWLAEGGRDTLAAGRDSSAFASPQLAVLNGYGWSAAAQVLHPQRVAPRAAAEWRNVERLGRIGVPLREIGWSVERDSLFALFFGRDGYEEALVSATRDVAGGVRVRPHPVERADPRGRELARYFSDVLWIERPGARVGVYFRLWDLARDLSAFQLFQSSMHEVGANHPAVLAHYQAVVGGFIGNSETGLLGNGDFGPRLQERGDGIAEQKFLETAELLTRQFIRGSTWLWQHFRPALQVEYFPLLDNLDHHFLGWITPGTPGFDPRVAERVNAVRNRGWALADRRFAELRALAREGDALLVLSGDHGMRPTWRWFQVNVALRDAGLLVLDGEGRPDLTRTQAYSANGYYVHVNRAGRSGGIVPAERVDAVADSVGRVLLGARSPEDRAIVSRVWRPEPQDSLGIGGRAGGEVYFDLAEGYYYSSRLGETLTSPMDEPGGSHGFPSVDPDMRTVLCGLGPGVAGRRFATARVIDAAPTVSDWLGIPAPVNATGISLLERMRRTTRP